MSGDTGELKINLNSQQDGIWVNGTGMVYATPDIAILRIGVEAQKTTVAEARDEV
ncbi:MAG: SIMPL domain-containing protein [Candidatus Odinarchaeota archaeon]